MNDSSDIIALAQKRASKNYNYLLSYLTILQFMTMMRSSDTVDMYFNKRTLPNDDIMKNFLKFTNINSYGGLQTIFDKAFEWQHSKSNFRKSAEETKEVPKNDVVKPTYPN